MTNQLSERGAPLGLFLGAVVGGAFVALWYMVQFTVAPVAEGGTYQPGVGAILSWGLISFILGAFTFGVGLVLVGLPGWFVLHRMGRRGPGAAIAWGAFATLAVTALWDLNMAHTVRLDWNDLLLALDGALVGFVIQRLAYRPKPPPAPTSAAPTP